MGWYPPIGHAATMAALASLAAGLGVRLADRISQEKLDVKGDRTEHVVVPLTGDDREYLKMMYKEHAEHARQHEMLRAAVTGLMMALVAGLLAFAVEQLHETTGKQWVAGLLVCCISILGALLNHKHYERYRLHLRVLRAYRSSLESGLTLGLSNINENNRKIHEEEYWFTHKWIRLNILWIVIYVATFLIGATLVCLGDPPSFHHPEPPVLDYTG